MKKYSQMTSYSSATNRIALNSFLLTSANISKLIWPSISENTKEPLKSRRQRRREHLEKFFPDASYPNLKNKNFRNFLEHFDDELDKWDESSESHNLIMGSMGKISIDGDGTVWQNVDPSTLSVTNYHSETADLKSMYQEIEKLHQEIPRALTEIEDAPPNHFDFLLEE
jgi:hypothetical protein